MLRSCEYIQLFRSKKIVDHQKKIVINKKFIFVTFLTSVSGTLVSITLITNKRFSVCLVQLWI